jgi:hypothetical protein
MTRIYALVSGQLVLYVGQTRNTLRKREREHRSKGNTSCSKYIPDDIDWEIKLLEECEDVIATTREQHYYDTLKPFYNRCRPGQTHTESQRKYLQTEAGKESQKKYRQTEACKESKRKYEQTETRKESVRKYRQTEARKEYQREYNKRYRAAKKAAERLA